MRFLKLLAAGFSLLALSCNDNAKTSEEQHADTATAVTATANDTPSQPAYDAATDGMLTAGPLAKKLGDTLGVKMYELTMKPGDSAVFHRHPDHAVYVLQGGKAAIYFDGTNRQEWEFKPGMAFVSGPVADAAKNIGKTTIKLILVDMYRPRPK
jgi:quercetin dioxygenase-like cupin family protein